MGLSNDNTKKAKAARYSAWGINMLRILPKILAGGTWVQEKALLGLRIYLWEYTRKTNLEFTFPLKVPATLTL